MQVQKQEIKIILYVNVNLDLWILGKLSVENVLKLVKNVMQTYLVLSVLEFSETLIMIVNVYQNTTKKLENVYHGLNVQINVELVIT